MHRQHGAHTGGSHRVPAHESECGLRSNDGAWPDGGEPGAVGVPATVARPARELVDPWIVPQTGACPGFGRQSGLGRDRAGVSAIREGYPETPVVRRDAATDLGVA